MNPGKLNEDRCIVCGEAVGVINGYLIHIEFDASHQAALPPGYPLGGSVAPFAVEAKPADIRTIQVSPDVSLQFDIADGWFSLVDADNAGYDEMGAVLMVVEDVDPLIVALGQLREQVAKSQV